MMEKSQHYYRRKELMKKLQVPTIGETRHELGNKTAEILFDQCPNPLKAEFGLVPTLDGPGNELWVSPSDLLIPKVALKPPLTNKYIRALTHEGILSIGEGIDARFWRQMENEKAMALEDQRELIMRIAEMERKVAIKLAREEEREIAAAHVEHLMKEFEKRLVEELNNLEEHILGMQDEIVRKALEECDENWRRKLEREINETIQRMTERFTENIENEKKELEEQFRLELQKQNAEFSYALKREQEFCSMTLKQLRHCLECKNLANLMYVLCMERRKCTIEQSAMEYIYKNQISELEEKSHQKDLEILQLTEEKNRKQQQLDVREKCLIEILKQFQKFINFALKAAPTQAEFLLSVEKMIFYEIAKETWKNEKKSLRHVCKRILSWKSDEELTQKTPQLDSKNLDNLENLDYLKNLEPKDYHQCLNETDPKKDIEESEILPYFYYNNKLYVRNEIEYYFDRNIEISETNLLWNKDVDNLMQILKVTMKDKSENEDDLGSGCDDNLKTNKVVELEDKEKDKSKEKDINQEKEEKHKVPEDDIPSLHSKQQLWDSKTSKHSESSKKSLVSFQGRSMSKADSGSGLKPALKTLDEVVPKTADAISSTSPQLYDAPIIDNIGLLAAQDSLSTIKMSRKSSPIKAPETPKEDQEILQRGRGSKQNALTEGGTVSFEQFQAIRILDEIELTRPSNRSSKVSLAKTKQILKPDKDSILQKRSPTKSRSNSRLLQTTDSLIIHRNSITQGLSKLYKQPEPPKPTHFSHGSLISKLSFTRDSLELLRKQQQLDKKDEKKDGKKIDEMPSTEHTIVLSKPVKSTSKPSQIEEGYQKVKKVISPTTISHIEVAKIPTDIKEGEVRFSPIHEVYETNVLKTSDSPWNIYREEIKPKLKPSKEIIKPMKFPKAGIVGDTEARESIESSYTFTDKRITSIMNILREDASLIRLFTGVKN